MMIILGRSNYNDQQHRLHDDNDDDDDDKVKMSGKMFIERGKKLLRATDVTRLLYREFGCHS